MVVGIVGPWWIGDLVALAVAGGLYALAFLPEPAAAGLPFLHPLFTDHMVLQRDRPVPVWGWTKPGAKVMVTLAGKAVTAKAGRDGRWEALVGPLPAGGSHALEVSGPAPRRGAAPEKAVVTDVMIGDVWLCSGQSNMQMGIAECLNGKAEIAAADHPGIRLFSVPNRIAATPERTLAARWEVCTPANVARGGWGGFSACAYYFGRFLHRELKVPIGLIHASWGGTVAEAWVSQASLVPLGDFAAALAAQERSAELEGRSREEFDRELAAWWRKNDPGTASAPGWMAPAHADADWKTMTLPVKWEDAGLPDFDGVVWFRRSFGLPAAWEGLPLTLRLGKIDDRDVTWLNGVRVGALDQYDADRKYAIPAGVAKAGMNVLAVRVLDTGGAGGLYGPAEDMWIGPPLAPAAERVILTGSWKYRETADLRTSAFPQRIGDNPNIVTVLSNGMIEPLTPFGINGAIWYQGESNAGRAGQYGRLLPALIRDWRARFRSGEFPFLIVSLANWQQPAAEPPAQDAWAELREAQAVTAATVPACGLAVAIDVGEVEDIHPKNKQDVGRRLGLAALRVAYGDTRETSGPAFRAMTVTGGEARIAFDHAAGLRTADGGPVRGFAVPKAGGGWCWAPARIAGDEVVVPLEPDAGAAKVRYAWAVNPVCNLVNGAGLPAVPFRTDAP